MPDWNQRRLKPVAHRAEPVNAGVAAGAKRNQKALVMDAGTPVVDGEFPLRPTPLAPAISG